MEFNHNANRHFKKIAFLVAMSILVFSCEELLDVDPQKARVDSSLVFSNDVTATSAILGVYVDMLKAGFASGANSSTMGLAGLSADEFIEYNQRPEFSDFQNNVLLPTNPNISLWWESAYNIIYQTNAIIEGLTESDGTEVTEATRQQLLGEAHFIRAFCYFYLANLFGDVPLALTTDYLKNSHLPRSSVSTVYSVIVEDLTLAQDLLIDAYPTSTRARPNKATATALLARVYLYSQKWSEAELEATKLIANSTLYTLVTDPNRVFLRASTETIWQIRPSIPGYNTNDARTLVITGAPVNFTLSNNILSSFENNDLRYNSWVKSITVGSNTFYYPFKYKAYLFDSNITNPSEYAVIFRLAEQYLIRAEARAMTDNLAGAISDLDMIRQRAGLQRIADTNPGINKGDLLATILHERQIEFFSEWGHRWLDLKRTSKAEAVLSPIKSNWNKEDSLYPLPANEFRKNSSLGLQNPGY